MGTKIKSNLKSELKLSDIDVGDWFYCYDPSCGLRERVMIKGDDVTHEGTKTICMAIGNGVLVRLNNTEPVKLINSVELIYT